MAPCELTSPNQPPSAAALQYRVVEGAISSFVDMIKTVTKDLNEHLEGRAPPGAGERGPEFVCATMNDCQQHMNYLLTLSEDVLDIAEVPLFKLKFNL